MTRMPLQLYGMTVSKKIVGHVPLSWSKVASKFLQFTNHHTRVEETGKRVIIPVIYFLMEMQESTWVENSLEKLDNELHVKAKKCA